MHPVFRDVFIKCNLLMLLKMYNDNPAPKQVKQVVDVPFQAGIQGNIQSRVDFINLVMSR